MPAYNFQRQFVGRILSLEKPHTIRPERKHPTKKGDTLYLFTGQRTTQCRLIAESPCINIERIGIYLHNPQPYVMINDYGLSVEALDRLIRRDGFEHREDFFEFFMCYPRDVRENNLRLIWWSTKKLVNHWEVQYGR